MGKSRRLDELVLIQNELDIGSLDIMFAYIIDEHECQSAVDTDNMQTVSRSVLQQ